MSIPVAAALLTKKQVQGLEAKPSRKAQGRAGDVPSVCKAVCPRLSTTKEKRKKRRVRGEESKSKRASK